MTTQTDLRDLLSPDPAQDRIPVFGGRKEYEETMDVLRTVMNGIIGRRRKQGLTTEISKVAFSKGMGDMPPVMVLHWKLP